MTRCNYMPDIRTDVCEYVQDNENKLETLNQMISKGANVIAGSSANGHRSCIDIYLVVEFCNVEFRISFFTLTKKECEKLGRIIK